MFQSKKLHKELWPNAKIEMTQNSIYGGYFLCQSSCYKIFIMAITIELYQQVAFTIGSKIFYNFHPKMVTEGILLPCYKSSFYHWNADNNLMLYAPCVVLHLLLCSLFLIYNIIIVNEHPFQLKAKVSLLWQVVIIMVDPTLWTRYVLTLVTDGKNVKIWMGQVVFLIFSKLDNFYHRLMWSSTIWQYLKHH